MSNNPWIGVDLDGTLAKYDGWFGPQHVGEPVIPMLNRVKAWLKQGYDVKIVTARVSMRDPVELKESRDAIEKWCLEHVGKVLEVTNEKDFNMIQMWDDRAVSVRKNHGMAVMFDEEGDPVIMD